MVKVGVGVIGVGEMGKRHAENLARLVPKARLVGIADADLERARSIAQELEIVFAGEVAPRLSVIVGRRH